MAAQRSTSPLITPVVAPEVAAQPPVVAPEVAAQPPVVVADEEALEEEPEDAVPAHRVRQFRQFRELPVRGNPAQQRNLLPAAEVRVPPQGLRVPAEEAAVAAAAVVPGVAVALRPDAAVVAAGVVMPAALVVVVLPFRAWRSSICCWRPAWT